MRPQWKPLVISGVLTIPLSAFRFSPAPLIKYMTDSILVKKDTHALVLLPFAVVGLALMNLFVRFGQAYLARLANERVMQGAREKLFAHYLDLSSAFFTESSVGTLMSRVMTDVSYISHGTVNYMNIVREALTLAALFCYAAYLNWKLLALTIVIAPFLVWLGKRSGTLMKGYSHKIQEANGVVFSILQEAFAGFRVIKAFALEKAMFQRFKKTNDDFVRYALKAARVDEIGGPSVELAGSISIALIFYVGGLDVIHGRLTAGDLLAFFTSFGLMINPIRALNELNLKVNLAAAAADRVHDTLLLKSEIVEGRLAQNLAPFSGQIEFCGVGFKYGAELPWVFRGISFNLRRGKTLAIVGASGQGKSTLVNLLPRFYDAIEGKIIVDGHDIRDVALKSLRSQIAIVTQDVFLFNDTLFRNVAAGREDFSRDQVIDALKAAQAWSFVEKLPEGLDTIIGDRGQKLSGGERQRISIARAILRNTPILILDEATSSLDSESEKAVQCALDRLMEGRTTLVIAHRLSTVKHADRILVMVGGRVHESGTHEELLALRGEYARYYALLS